MTFSDQKIKCSVITALEPRVLSKSFELDGDALMKQPGGNLSRGTSECAVLTITEFAALLDSLKPIHALTYGLPAFDRAEIIPRAKLEDAKAGELPVIARTREFFAWPEGPGILMLDYDPAPDVEPMSRDELLRTLYDVWPDLQTHPHVWAASASSCIYRSDTGEELRGIMGQRVYIPVADARDIPRAGAALFSRFWLAGRGRFDISKSGALLDRSLVDASVWQPERLDFAGGAACGPGLEQRRPTPVVYNSDGGFIDTALTLPDLTREEHTTLDQLKAEARRQMQPTSQARQQEWIEERVAETGVKDEKAEKATREIYRRAITDKRLLGDFVLHTEKHGALTVAQILDDPDKHHGLKCADPLEPDYGNDPRIAWVNLRAAGRPYLWSHAHGGCRFTLHRALKSIRIEGGELPAICRKTLELMRIDGALFDRGGELVRMGGGALYGVTPNWFAAYASGVARFEKFDARKNDYKAVDCPAMVAHVILESAGEWGLPKLRGIITAPTMTPEGRVIDTDGYDAKSGLYLDFPDSDGWAGVPETPTDQDCAEAVEHLWRPFRDFPFVDAVARGGFLAAILTAVVRPLLPTAPGFGIFAPTAGSGKTLLAECLAALSGQDARVIPRADAEDEVRKRLLAAARGGSAVLLLDNLSGTVESESLCAFLTSPVFEDRILGASTMVSVPTNALCILNGNNPIVVGDLNRRLIRVVVDPQCERPHERVFEVNPLFYVQGNRLAMVKDALTILRAAIQRADKPATGFGSFEDWSDFVRRAVVWVGAQGWLDVADPVQSVVVAFDEDPDTQKLGALLTAWKRAFGARGATIPEALKRAKTGNDDDLFAAMNEIAGERDIVNPRRLGRWLEGRVKRIVGGNWLDREGKRQNYSVWTVRAESGAREFGENSEFSHTQRGKLSTDISIDRAENYSQKSRNSHFYDEGLDDDPTVN